MNFSQVSNKRKFTLSWIWFSLRTLLKKRQHKQECIPVGCVPSAHWPHVGAGGRVWQGACVAHTCPLPCMPPPATHAPCHTCPLPCMPPTCPYAHHACPPPHMPPIPPTRHSLYHARPPATHTHPSLWTDRHLWRHNLHKLRLLVVNI